MSEIVVVEPSIASSSNANATNNNNNGTQPFYTITSGRDHVPEPFDSEKLPVTLKSEIQRFLRVANLIDAQEPRVACLCRFHAFVVAHDLDRNSSGRGVRQFKTALLQRLEQDEEVTYRKRKEKSDVREVRRVYRKYKDYIIKHGGESGLENRDALTKARAIADVLYEVSNTLTKAAGTQAHADNDVKRSEFYDYNILPLDQGGVHHAIMQLPEIKAAIAAVRNVEGIPFIEEFTNHAPHFDLFDWLQNRFRFQKGNVANQREHLILLLANVHIRRSNKPTNISKLADGALDDLMKKFFKNYTEWCKFLEKKTSVRLPFSEPEAQQYKILYIGLYLLIWGEAANLRFMPECLAYIFHHMAHDLHSMLMGATILSAGETFMPAYGGGPEAFLNDVVTPIYDVIQKEALKNQNGMTDYSTWRNYDDLNEFFWSPDCFQLGWPMDTKHDFFYVQSLEDTKTKKNKGADKLKTDKRKENNDEEAQLKEEDESKVEEEEKKEPTWLGKTNFVEFRSFWHVFRSFDRMWAFLVLSLQAMIIMACHDLESPLQMFDTPILEDIMSIFITSAVLKLVQAVLDIVFTWKARSTMDKTRTRKHALKVVIAVIWTIMLPIFYSKSRRKYTCYSTNYGSWFGEWCYSSYMLVVAFYLMSNAVNMILFSVPAIGRYIETSNSRISLILSWWTQPRLYVGRGMQESQYSLLKYSLFWMLLLLSKLAFSYTFEIKPLMAPTRQIMRIGITKYDWHELFPRVKNNAGAIAAIWAPVIMVYFMDTQIWYSVFCAVFGGLYGILHHLGEIRTLGMMRDRFQDLPLAFMNSLIPHPTKTDKHLNRKSFLKDMFQKVSESQMRNGLVKFIVVWNEIIKSFREEDLISNREVELMKMPLSSELLSGLVRWPVFLLAHQLPLALSIAKDFVGEDASLFKRIKRDVYMHITVQECYDSLKYILDILVVGDLERRVISGIVDEIEESIRRSTFVKDFNLSELLALHTKCIELVELLVEGDEKHYPKVVKALQDILEIVTTEMMRNGSRTMEAVNGYQQTEGCLKTYFDDDDEPDPQLFASRHSIHFPLPDSDSINEKIKRFLLLLTVKDTAMDIPSHLDARRRISFFATSLFMDIPRAPKVRNMLSFSVLTPHLMEEVKFSTKELNASEDYASIGFYMQKIYPDDLENFLERMGVENLKDLDDRGKEELRDWASFRGQTLSRTIRGMMYCHKALKLQAFLDMAEDDDIIQGYDAIERGNDTLSAQLDALADLKFTHVVSCQMFGSQKTSGDPQAQEILDLMIRYPSLRVAYVEEREATVDNKTTKIYYSVLVKAVNGFDQEIYRVKLPGSPNIGEGKPENQNHAIIFTRGEALQAIDMNQDNYLEEAIKMRNLLQEFLPRLGKRPKILGLREHIFTGSVSSLAWFMSYQETSFVTIGQRLLANPLRIRFHYGHPDLFDRIFHLTRGGISKASKTINLSEDIFAGYNTTLRRGHITYHEYIQVGKGRDVSLNQISKFEAKVANGNSEQIISRDIYRLGRRFDFFRMLSCYYTTVGFYFSSLISVMGIYVFLYGQLYLVLSGLEKALLEEAKVHNIRSLETALASQSFIQLGLLTGLPMVMEIALERGFLNALKDFVLMQLQLAAVFFTFSLGTKTHYFGRTILHGGAKYRPTGRRVVVFHASFTENYRLYSRSHFMKGFELLLLLIVHDIIRRAYKNHMTYVLITYAIWFLSLTWLFAPFLFNPSGFDWGKIVDDWKDWNKWIKQQGGIGIQQDKSWQSWWYDEQEHLRHSGWGSRVIEILLSLRFFIYQYGLVYHLDIAGSNKTVVVYVLSWVVIVMIFLLIKIVNVGRHYLSDNHQLSFRLFKASLFLSVIATILTLSYICQLSVADLIVCCFAFLPTGWGLILVAQAFRPLIQGTVLWKFTRLFAQAYDYGMGVFLFTPIACLAWLPIISAFQTRFLFNRAFSRRLQIQPILKAKKKNT